MVSSALNQRGFYITATRKSSGKTVISLGLGAALKNKGYLVQSYKKGPDYIDPMWHQAATQRPCFNLDFFTQAESEITTTFNTHRHDADVVYVEGNKGLFDGMDTNGSDCNAALAVQLGLPVVLIVNAHGITRGVAPLLKGYEDFSQDIQYAGIILNEVAGPRHEAKLIAAIEKYTDYKILGVVPKLSALHLQERHLGLVPENETKTNDSNAYIQKVAQLVNDHVDIDVLLDRSAQLQYAPKVDVAKRLNAPDIKIGVAQDAAFGFYYPDDLQAMQALGAELVFFDTLQDKQLPQVDALFIGGGFPEMQLAPLQENVRLRESIQQFIENGQAVYAECGGLMYLCQDIYYQGKTAQMVGVIDAKVEMTAKPLGRGYAKISSTEHHLWKQADDGEEAYDAVKCCHEFHYSKLTGNASDSKMAYDIKRGFGVNGHSDGIVVNNMLATYCHQRHTQNNPWVAQFIQFIRKLKESKHENN